MNATIDSTRLVFPKVAEPGKLERAWNTAYEFDSGSEVLFDMRRTRFIVLPTLTFLLARTRQLRLRNIPFSFRLPHSHRVRDYLRDWQFPEALASVTGESFYGVVDESDRHYFGENAQSRPTDMNTLLPRNWYPLQTFVSAEHTFGKSLAVRESTRWREGYVLSVLNRLFSHVAPNAGRRVASHVVHEAIMNAIRHPNGDTVVVSSFCDSRNPDSMPTARDRAEGAHLTFVVWDDGDSIIETLSNVLRSDAPIRSVDAGRLTREVSVKYVDGDRADRFSVRTDRAPDRSSPDWFILLSSTFPGISRDPLRAAGDAAPETTRENELYAFPGMGLYVLVNTVVDVFGGSLSIRCADHFMNIKRDPSTPGYKVKIQRYIEETARFPGNMLTVRLPTTG